MAEDTACLEVAHPAFDGLIGVARRDITPPVGIYSRMWGSAVHDVAEGIHRPLTATVLSLRPSDRDRPLVLVSLDLGWWRTTEDEQFLRQPILDDLSLDESQLMIHFTHTHAGPSTSLQAANKDGGDKIRPYLTTVRAAVLDAYREARSTERLATISWHIGRCNLACNRDQRHANGSEVIVGYDPATKADDTILVGRAADSSDNVMATIVNYACHPTSLGPLNRLISPDYVGALREVVEEAMDGAPCLFLNGAAGELAPRRQYTDRCDVADQNGRQLGYAALATLADMLPHRTKLRFERVVGSTARLGIWSHVDCESDELFRHQKLEIELPLRPRDGMSVANGSNEYESDRALTERIERTLHLWNGLDDVQNAHLPIWLWRLGRTVIVGTPAEMHSPFQIELRQQFSDYAVVVVNIVNGTFGYLPPIADYEFNTYQCNTSLFDRGSHEKIVRACVAAIRELTADPQIQTSLRQPHFSSRRTVRSGKEDLP